MSSFNPSSFLPYGAQFGSNMGAMIGQAPQSGAAAGSAAAQGSGFQGRAAGADMKSQMGGAAGIAGGAMGLVGAVTGGVAKIQEGKALQDAGLKAAGRTKKAQAGLDMAASAAEMAGPIGMAIAAPLKLISMLLNIQGPRKKREKKRLEMRNKQTAKHASMRANAASAGMQAAGGALRTGAMIGPEATVPDPTGPTHSFSPTTTYNGR
jgi:hypothetical protein